METKVFVIALDMAGSLPEKVLENYIQRAIIRYYKDDPQNPFHGIYKPFSIVLAREIEMPDSSAGPAGTVVKLLSQVEDYFKVLKRLGGGK